MAGVFVRSRYYFGWKLAEASMISCGIAYNGEDKHGVHWYDAHGAAVLE